MDREVEHRKTFATIDDLNTMIAMARRMDENVRHYKSMASDAARQGETERSQELEELSRLARTDLQGLLDAIFSESEDLNETVFTCLFRAPRFSP